MFTKLFWKDTLERVIATLAQVVITLWSVDQFDLLAVDWQAFVASLAVAAVLVVAKALAAAKFTGPSVSPASFAGDARGVVRR